VKALRAHGVREGTALLSVTLAPDDGGVDVDVEIIGDGDVGYEGEEGVVGGRCQDGDEGEEGDGERWREDDMLREGTDGKINTLFKWLHCNRASNASNAEFELERTRPRDEMHDDVDFPVDQNEREDDRRDNVLPTALQPRHLGDELDALVLDDEDRRLVEGWRGPWILNNEEEEEEEVDMEKEEEIYKWGDDEYNTLFKWIRQARRKGDCYGEDGEEKKDWDWDEEDEEDEDEEWDENEVVIEDYDEDEDEDEDEEDEEDEGESWDENEAIIEDYDEDDESELEPVCENAFQGDSRGNLLVQNKRPNVAQEFDGDRGLVEWRCQGVIAEESQKAHLSTAERSDDEQRISLAQKLEILDLIAKDWVLAQLWRGEMVYSERQRIRDEGGEKEDEAEDEVVFRGRRMLFTP
jgi:hypothetical protein